MNFDGKLCLEITSLMVYN